ncbi:response regulator [Dryocola clanedunensis]
MSSSSFYSLILFFCLSYSAVAQQLTLKSNFHAPVADLKLNAQERQLLASKKRLTVGTWLPEVSPIVYESSGEDYLGVNADYLALMQKSLNVKVIIKQYASQQQALAALARNEVDTLLTQLSHEKEVGKHLLRSPALIKTWPTLVTTLKNTLQPLATRKTVNVACVRDCAFMGAINAAFPHAHINLYDTDYQAMSSLISGENQYFIGNNITTSHCISRYFSQSLVVTHYFNQQEQDNYFVTNRHQPLLRNILERFILSIGNDIHMRIMQNWLNRGNLSWLNTPLSFNADEKAWLEKHARVRVLINPYFPPFTLVDRDGELRGIMGDLLNIIKLQTGLEFEAVLVHSSSEQEKAMSRSGWEMFPAAVSGSEQPASPAFSDPVINVSFVLVTTHREAADSLLAKPRRIALPVGRYMALDLKQRYQQVEWVGANDVAAAMKMLSEGKVDAVVTTELSARYMIDHYYPQSMRYQRLPGMPAAAISFVMPPDEPQLKSIVNKALQAIPPREILQMTEKWSKISTVQIDTWQLYSKQFYQVVAFALVLIVISLGWALSLSREVRKRKQSQQLLEEHLRLKETLSHELEAEKDKAIQATRAKSRFLASMSHELRTPVSSIVGFLELISGNELTPGQRKEAIALTGATAQSLLGLIGKILDVDKIESGKYQLVRQWTDITPLVDLQCHSFDALARQKGIALRCVSHLAASERVLIDPQALRQILTNLVGNALKFTEQGHIDVSARLMPDIDQHGTLILTVSDTGCGISEEEQSTLFHRYAQARQGRAQTGSGLGLVICKELVSLMEGHLGMTSLPSQGTTFTITLPVETARQVPTTAPDAPSSAAPLHRLSILIADDNPTNRLLLKRQLNTIGYSVDEACDGEEAEARVTSKHYDLLITDMNMPKKDGLALAESLRRQHYRLQIWGLTASALSSTREQCLQSGMDRCLFKPVSIQSLADELNTLDAGHRSSCVTQHLKLSILTENTGGDRALMNEILETFREASANDIQAAELAVEQGDPQAFLRALHRLHGSAQILEIGTLQSLCEPFESRRHHSLSQAECQAALQHVTAIMKDIEVEIDSLISH